MNEDDKVGSERVRLRKMWDECYQQAKTTTESHNTNMQMVIGTTPRSSDNYIDDVKDDSTGTSSTESESVSEGKHAMVMLGFITVDITVEVASKPASKQKQPACKQKRLYVLWNWWAHMPLVVVSLEYMVACQCEIFFLHKNLPVDITKKVKSDKALFVECSFPDHAENTVYREGERDSDD
jgi:hypothetical protein